MRRSVWIGFDPREGDAYAVASYTARKRCITPMQIKPLVLDELRHRGLYTRPTIANKDAAGNVTLFDQISEHPMATEFAISRFLVPHLVKTRFDGGGWALFMDSDVLVRRSLETIFDQARDEYAVMVVKHHYEPPIGVKMDGQAQTRYARKNWSSVMLFNVDHPSNRSLDPELVNSLPGRDLHAFCWLRDEEIGELSIGFNYLVGHHSAADEPNPHIVHFTEGIPRMPGYRECEYADEWQMALSLWAMHS